MKRAFVLAMILLVVSQISALGMQFKLTILDNTPKISTMAESINKSGQIVGDVMHYYGVPSNRRPVIWDADMTMSYIPTQDANEYQAIRINDNGDVVLYSDSCYYIWNDNGQWDKVGLSQYDAVKSMNDSKVIVGEENFYTSVRAYVYDFNKQSYRYLPGLDGVKGHALAINDSNIIAGIVYKNTAQCAARWDANGNLTVLTMPSVEWRLTAACDINNSNVVVGRGYDSNNTPCALKWDADGKITILASTLGSETYATSINNRGQIIGRLDNKPIFWDADGTMSELPSIGYGLWANSINDSGCIVGGVKDAQGYSHAALWEPVPEPSSILTLLCGIGGLGGIVWKRKIA